MNLKQKIALAELAKKVDRGIISEAKGRELFEQITGKSADAVPVDGEDDDLTAHVEAIGKKTVKKVTKKVQQDSDQPDTEEKKSEAESQSPFKVATAEEVVSLLQQLKAQTSEPNPDRIDTERVKEKQNQEE